MRAAATLLRWRQEQGLSQSQAGELVAVGRICWREYETGGKIPPLARALQIEEQTGGVASLEIFGYGDDVIALMRAALARRGVAA